MEEGICTISTSTFSTGMNELRAELSLRFAEEAADCGYQLVIVDGSRNEKTGWDGEEFRNALRERGAIVFREELGSNMGLARRQSIACGLALAGPEGASCFIEPQKVGLIRYLKYCFAPILRGAADMVVPCRTPKSWESYPRLQRLNEPFGNYSFELATRRGDLDMFFGPRCYNQVAGKLFIRLRGDLVGDESWGTTHYPVIDAIREQLEVMGVPVDYIHPAQQAQMEDTSAFYEKRVEQVRQLARGSFIWAMCVGTMPYDFALLAQYEREEILPARLKAVLARADESRVAAAQNATR